jgi:hypothetical protein
MRLVEPDVVKHFPGNSLLRRCGIAVLPCAVMHIGNSPNSSLATPFSELVLQDAVGAVRRDNYGTQVQVQDEG